MAKQKFSAVQREALWLAHNKKCAYTRGLLDISSFHIDHVIPENLAEEPIALEEVIAQLGLDSNFNLHGYENLLPCQPGTNLHKNSLLLDPAPLHFFLNIASSKKAEVEANLVQIEKRQDANRALILLQQCLESGKLSALEVAKILEENIEQPEVVFRLIERMQFSDIDVQSITKLDIEEFRDRPIKLGLNDHIDGVILINDVNEQVSVRTCREYDQAIKAGFYAFSNFDIKMSSFFEHKCGLLRLLQLAATPQRSFFAEPKVGVLDLQLLPFSLFPSLGEEVQESQSLTYQDKVDDGTITIQRVRQNLLCVESEEMGQQLIEVVRADFNGDGTEDILLFEYCYAIHGTLGYGGIQILARKTPEGVFEVLPQ